MCDTTWESLSSAYFSVRRVSVCLLVRFPRNAIPDLILPSPTLGIALKGFSNCFNSLTVVIASHRWVVLSRRWPGQLATRTLTNLDIYVWVEERRRAVINRSLEARREASSRSSHCCLRPILQLTNTLCNLGDISPFLPVSLSRDVPPLPASVPVSSPICHLPLSFFLPHLFPWLLWKPKDELSFFQINGRVSVNVNESYGKWKRSMTLPLVLGDSWMLNS